MTTAERSRAARLGWIHHDVEALKRSIASVKGWETRRSTVSYTHLRAHETGA